MNLTKIIAGLLVALAIGLAILAWMLGRQPQRPVAPPPSAAPAITLTPRQEPAPTHDVVVAAQPIGAGHRLAAEDLKVVPMGAAVPGSFGKVDALLGHTTALALPAGAPLFEQHLLNGLALQLEPGQRAVSIAVNEGMAAGHRVRPGDFVDVFFTLDGKKDDTPVDTQTRLLLARSRVLAYGGASVENPPLTDAQRQQQQEEQARQESSAGLGSGNRRANATREDPAQRPENAKTAVLAVPLDDVERLALAEKYGQLTLALRHPDDLAQPDPALFAALPAVLQPAAGRLAKGEALQGIDRSVAGLRFDDLATGGDDKNRKRAAPPLLPAPKVPQPLQAAQQRRLQDVEIHHGANVQMVRY
ncbi:Flp pilus assembly protein CpaB [Corticibacter populi]|uniref:Flp pilus assembly protein CpaB n=1 Tax=Corticibacter populi TaxID=1550736 RepID=A0A3M6QUZ0_9BURK|nr:Flp pilus assembly protein CpaB [Corticibacter populi]RMX06312.1 Flp pilus assembly protein CpaB [Corticibacter populi]RZS32152.1 pilus assembly protein CpaB [Corticibacter populi]